MTKLEGDVVFVVGIKSHRWYRFHPMVGGYNCSLKNYPMYSSMSAAPNTISQSPKALTSPLSVAFHLSPGLSHTPMQWIHQLPLWVMCPNPPLKHHLITVHDTSITGSIMVSIPLSNHQIIKRNSLCCQGFCLRQPSVCEMASVSQLC